MENLFERVCELVGKFVDDPMFKQFVEELGEQPVIQERPNGKSRLLSFNKLQLGLVAHVVDEQWIIRGGGMLAQSTNLPRDLLPKDGRDEVQRKLGQHPVSSIYNPDQHSWKDRYLLTAIDLEFVFDSDVDELRYWQVSREKSESSDTETKK